MARNLIPDNFVERTDLKLEELAEYNLDLMQFRVWDSITSNLPSTSASDDLTLAGNSYGASSSVYLATSDLKAAGATTRYARIQFPLPPEYVAGGKCRVVMKAGMLLTVADTSATCDVNCYVSDEDLTSGASDLVTTSATSCNSLTLADKSFTITSTNLEPGKILDLRVALSINDAATGTGVYGVIQYVKVLLDIRG